LLDDNLVPKIADFGWTRILDTNTKMTGEIGTF